MAEAQTTAPAARALAEPMPGLVWAYGFDGEGRAKPLAGTAIGDALAATDGWVWLHFNLADMRARAWIEDRAPVPSSARDLLLETDDHLCLIAEDDALLGVFADFRRDFDHDTHDIARLKFALHGRVLVTGRRQALQSIDEVRRALAAGATVESGAALLEMVFDDFAHRVGAMTRELAGRLEVMEERVVDDRIDPEDLRVGPIRRTALRFNRQVGALRIHFVALVENPERDLPDEVFAMTERVALRLTSVGRDIEAIQERARIVQEEAAAKSAEYTNRQLSILSALTAIFLPATLVTGLFGMNTHGLPFDAHEEGFWLASVVAAAGSGAVYLFLRRKRIL